MKPLVYVAGPITGNPWGCVRQGTDAFRWLRAAGCVPFLPQLSVLHEMVDPQPYEEWMAYDFDLIERCQALVRLPGESPGADREVAHAETLGLPVFVVVEYRNGYDGTALGAHLPYGPDGGYVGHEVADWAAAWTEAHS